MVSTGNPKPTKRRSLEGTRRERQHADAPSGRLRRPPPPEPEAVVQPPRDPAARGVPPCSQGHAAAAVAVQQQPPAAPGLSRRGKRADVESCVWKLVPEKCAEHFRNRFPAILDHNSRVPYRYTYPNKFINGFW